MVVGIKFWDAKKKVLLKSGCINGEYETTLEPESFPITEFKLDRDERILGVKSGESSSCADHSDFIVLIGKDPSKFLLLQLFANRKQTNSK